MQPQTRSINLMISGRVQGVGMRYYLVGNARGLGLVGWVHNRTDGRVECMAQGDSSSIDQFINAARQGPPAARIDDIQVSDTDHQPDLKSFEVRY
ncbi:MAG: acylphosphatase [Spirochaeta sp.]